MNAIQKYFRYRQSLIDQYIKGDMTKKEYLEMNYNAVMTNGIKPFKNTDTVEKGLYNYQYYNALAKQMKSVALSYGKDEAAQRDYTEKADYYYRRKDRATLRILKLLDYKGVASYFINVRSRELKGRLIEIVIENENIVLHSANPSVLAVLREENIFTEENRKSLVDTYINQKY